MAWRSAIHFPGDRPARRCPAAPGTDDLRAAYVVRYAHGGMQFIVSKEFAVTSFETTFVWGVWVDAVTVDTLAVKTLLMT